MSINFNWTAAGCLVALALGLWNAAYSWIVERRQRKRLILDKVQDIAVELAIVTVRYRTAKDEKSKFEYATELGGLCLSLETYGYAVDSDCLRSGDEEACGEEIAKLLVTIMYQGKKLGPDISARPLH